MPGIDLPARYSPRNVGIGALVILLLGTSAYGLAALVRERRHTQDLTASNAALTASLVQMQGQLQTVSDKLNALGRASRRRAGACHHRGAAEAGPEHAPPEEDRTGTRGSALEADAGETR